MAELRLYFPTYRPRNRERLPAEKEEPEFGDPQVPVLVHSAQGVRIVLGSHDRFDNKAPDIQIERRADGWVIFLHPLPGCDPSGFVYVFDDRTTFVLPEYCAAPTVSIRYASSEGEIVELKRRGRMPNDRPAAT